MPKINGNGKNRGNQRRHDKPMVGRDRPLPPTLPADLKPYDTNNDGVLSTEERSAMRIAKLKERREELMQKDIDENERRAGIKKANSRPDRKNK